MKYKIGDKVRVKSLEWYNSKKSDYGFTIDDVTFDHQMSIYCGRLAIIEKLGISYYRIDIDNGELYWYDWMFEDGFEVQKGKDLIPNVLNAESLEEKRFYAACCAMQGIISGIISGVGLNQIDYPSIAKESYSLADEMLEQGGFN